MRSTLAVRATRTCVTAGCFLAALCAYAADPCATQRTTIEMNQCAEQTLKATEGQLNLTYKRVLKSLSKPDDSATKYSEMKRLITQAQRSWLAFRANDCKAWLKLNEGGSVRTVAYLGCLESRAKQRTDQLKLWLER